MLDDTSRQALLDALSDARPEAFTSLKKLIKASPTLKQWRRLCEELKRWEDCEPQTFEALLSYIKEMIAPWHRHFELTIHVQWFARLLRDQPCPQLSLLESLDLSAGWDVSSYTQNAQHLSSLTSLRHERLTSLNESSLWLMLQELKLPKLRALTLRGRPNEQGAHELELLSQLGQLELPALEQLTLKGLQLSAPTLLAWLDSSWAPSLRQLTLASASVMAPHIYDLFEAAQDGRLDPELHLVLPSHVRDGNGHLHQEHAQVICLQTTYIRDYGQF